MKKHPGSSQKVPYSLGTFASDKAFTTDICRFGLKIPCGANYFEMKKRKQTAVSKRSFSKVFLKGKK